MLQKLAAGVTLALVCPGVASAVTPPWCSSDSLSLSERMICVDGLLSQLDLEMSETYEAARRVGPNLDQQGWLAERNQCGMEVTCLEEAYRSRISELRAVASGLGTGFGEAPRSGGADDIDTGLLPAPGGITVPELSSSSERPWLEIPDMSDLQARLEDLAGTPRLEVSEDSQIDRAVAPLDQPPGRFAGSDMLPTIDGMIPRPWCGASRLNPTERTICADRDLSRLDALLELVYGRRTARDDDRAQVTWLRSERDACSTDSLCISSAYAARIAQLNDATVRLEEPSRDMNVPPGHHPPPGSCRVWYPGRPPGQQPPPSSCDVHVPSGAVLIEGRYAD